jgi:glutathione S-transferase
MSSAKPTLWHIGFSHYNEKARWALDYKSVAHERRAALPGSHPLVALWLTRGRRGTFPVLKLDGQRIGDSTAIIAALEARFPEPPLYLADPDEHRRALELEDWFDEELGPHLRQLYFHEAGRDPRCMAKLAVYDAPRWLPSTGRMSAALGRAFTNLRFRASSAEEAERSRKKVLEALDRLELELGSEEYLVGDLFSVADLTAAALFYPLVLPPGLPLSVDHAPEPYLGFRATLEGRAGFKWVREMFRRHRHRHRRAERLEAQHA